MAFKASPIAKLLILITATTVLSACNDSVSSSAGTDFNGGTGNAGNDSGNGSGNNVEFNKTRLLHDLTDKVFVPAIKDFEAQSNTQVEATTAYCEALKSDQAINNTLLDEAKAAWQASMSSWQHIEVMQLGPLLDNDAELRNKIYSWPVTNSCAVDQDVGFFEAGTTNGSDYDINLRTATRRGLDALEYLLFNDNIDHSCTNDSFAPENWNQRPQLERQIARCEYAVEVATDINNSAAELNTAWTGETPNNYASVLKNAETNGEFETIDDAINRVSDALFYIDKITKDAKLGAPIGLIANSCGTATCLSDIESRISAHSLQNIRANMVAMQLIFKGGNSDTDVGFDDYLVAVDASALAVTMATDIQAMIDAIDAFEGDFEAAVTNEPAKVQNLYENIKKVGDNLKSAFITFLSLQLPASSAGDAD